MHLKSITIRDDLKAGVVPKVLSVSLLSLSLALWAMMSVWPDSHCSSAHSSSSSTDISIWESLWGLARVPLKCNMTGSVLFLSFSLATLKKSICFPINKQSFWVFYNCIFYRFFFKEKGRQHRNRKCAANKIPNILPSLLKVIGNIWLSS